MKIERFTNSILQKNSQRYIFLPTDRIQKIKFLFTKRKNKEFNIFTNNFTQTDLHLRRMKIILEFIKGAFIKLVVLLLRNILKMLVYSGLIRCKSAEN